MQDYLLAFGFILQLAAVSVYLYLGLRLRHRTIEDTDVRFAWRWFVVWWLGLGLSSLFSVLMNILGQLGVRWLAIFVGVQLSNLLFVSLALLGLLFYLAFLIWGRRKVFPYVAVFYVLFYIALVVYILSSQPVGVEVTAWSTSLEYANSQDTMNLIVLLLLILLLFPQIISGLIYFSLFFRVRQATQRYRIALVSWSIIIWFSSPLVPLLLDLGGQDWWQIVSRLIALGAATTIYFAYFPPPRIQKRLGVAAISTSL